MGSPAERYAAFRRRQATPEVTAFAEGYAFGLDAFQREACEALVAGQGVLVAAPTGAGKTVVGEFAVHLALARGTKCFYTTPIKALSNQKFTDLVARHGADNVGLLTGDNSVNGDAQIVVMTTEVLRNMLYAGSRAVDSLGYVVMDEVHYLSDRMRGAVWEEVIIHLPSSVTLVSLSATVSNTEEFAEWLVTVRGDTHVIVEEHRPVPLWQHMMAGHRLYDLFADEASLDVNPHLLRLAQQDTRFEPRGGRPRRPGRFDGPSRAEVINQLDREGLLPAITFIFSRAGCDAAVVQCLRAGIRLTTDAERQQIRDIVEERTADLPNEDLLVLGYHDWLDGLERGLAAHHAGMLPRFKEVVEDLFVANLIKAVFATETLSLGINMPARSVVLERLVKWNGESHVELTPGEYTQLTGRAGRRGIDVEGHAVVLWHSGIDPMHVAGLASTRTYPLRSSFRPSYNMAVNLVSAFGRERARNLLEQSFAQFQADRSMVGLTRQIHRNVEALSGYLESMTCHLGDFPEYAALRVALKQRESALARQTASSRRAAVADALETLKTGDVIRLSAGRRGGAAVVLDPGTSIADGPRPTVLTAERQVKRLTLVDFPVAVEVLGHVRVPKGFSARSAQHRRDLAAELAAAGYSDVGRPARARSAAADDQELAHLRARLRSHPCHGCADRETHARWAERHHALSLDTDKLRERVSGRTGTIARTFDRVCSVLTDLGYLDGERVLPAGERLARVYCEADLLVVECLERGVWSELSPADLAACVSALVFESRRADDAAAPHPPPPSTRTALSQMASLWTDLHDAELQHRLDNLPMPDVGFAWAAQRWASGGSLSRVLTGADLTAGDFVRWCRQIIDLLGQISDAAAGTPVQETARLAAQAVNRGVVAYSSTL